MSANSSASSSPFVIKLSMSSVKPPAIHQMSDLSKSLALVMEKVEKHRDKLGRLVSELFLALPSKTDYADYYDLIKQPVAIKTIQQKTASNAYTDVSELQQDFETLVQNAGTYNRKSSFIYKDALTLKGVFETALLIEFPTVVIDTAGAAKKLSEDCKSILKRVTSYKNDQGRVLATLFLEMPDAKMYPEYYVEVENPIAFDIIKRKVDRKEYKDAVAFEVDLLLMFDNAFQFNDEGSEVYDDANTLKEVYLQLVGKGSGPFASSHNATTKLTDVTVVESIECNGQTYQVGDYVYIANTDVSEQTYIVQVVEVWKQNKSEKLGFTGCWFLRGEQTVHKATQRFMENEVFKTNHYVNYMTEEVLGRAMVLFHKDYIRGKPKGFNIKDVYVCESRYVEPGKQFAKIKSWSTCVPEKVKGKEIELDYYDTVLVPNRVASIWFDQAPKKRKVSTEEEKAPAILPIKMPKITKADSPSLVARSQIPGISQLYNSGGSNLNRPNSTPRPPMGGGGPYGPSFPPMSMYPPSLAVAVKLPTLDNVSGEIRKQLCSFDEIVERFDSFDNMEGLKWFNAPPVNPPKGKEPLVHSLEYLLKKDLSILAPKAATPSLMDSEVTTKALLLPARPASLLKQNLPSTIVNDTIMTPVEDTILRPMIKKELPMSARIEESWAPVTDILNALADYWLDISVGGQK